MEPLRVAVLGAGNRGNVYGDYLLTHPEEGRVVAVAEPDDTRRNQYAARHGIGPEGRHRSWETLLDSRPDADAVIIATQDCMHVAPALRAMSLGYDVLLEKPVSPRPAECLALADASERLGRILTVCHVLRYTPFMQTLKRLLDEQRIGQVVSLQWAENVGWWHMAHSFVRGNWRRSDQSSPMILAKSCHDMDAIRWLVGRECQQISSFGSLMHFRPENAPPGAANRCTDACLAADHCPYNALSIYAGPATNWPTSVVTSDPSAEGRRKALATGPYGRCVYRCDNDVVDHQVVNMVFSGGVTASFSMVGFTAEMSRTMKFCGTHGEIRGHLERNEIEINDFHHGHEHIRLETPRGRHSGGDTGLMQAFLQQVRTRNTAANLSPARLSAETHLLAFAAEESRRTGHTVDFPLFARSAFNGQ